MPIAFVNSGFVFLEGLLCSDELHYRARMYCLLNEACMQHF